VQEEIQLPRCTSGNRDGIDYLELTGMGAYNNLKGVMNRRASVR
jgi:hypothetical protein